MDVWLLKFFVKLLFRKYSPSLIVLPSQLSLLRSFDAHLSTSTVFSNCLCSDCHLTTRSSLQNALGSYLMLCCSFMFFSLLRTGVRGKPISSLMIERNRSSNSLSDLCIYANFQIFVRIIEKMQPMIIKAECVTQASLITDSILMG